MSVVLAGLTTGLPHPLLTPDANPGYRRLRDAFAEAREVIRESGAERLVFYSTYWPSVIGHQAITNPNPRWTHVDELFHDLGSISYDRPVDAGLAQAVVDAAKRRGLSARGVNYHGFPMDTGSVTALELLDPDREWPAVVLSSNVYADRAETLVWAKATRDAIAESGRPTAVFAISSLSNRLFTTFIRPEEDAIHSPKDDEWNRKVLQFLGEGRLEDTAQLSRTIQQQNPRQEGREFQGAVVALGGRWRAQPLPRNGPRLRSRPRDGRRGRHASSARGGAWRQGVRRRRRGDLAGRPRSPELISERGAARASASPRRPRPA